MDAKDEDDKSQKSDKEIDEFFLKELQIYQNYPKKGIDFRDFQPILKDAHQFKYLLEIFQQKLAGIEFDSIIGLQARGFILGSALALMMGKAFVMIRQKGKLPGKVTQFTYKLEYGEDTFEINNDALDGCKRAIIVDDVLATGGTANAAAQLVKQIGGSLEAYVFLYEILALKGRAKLGDHSKIICVCSEK